MMPDDILIFQLFAFAEKELIARFRGINRPFGLLGYFQTG
jgi:hypothetical protein